MLASVFHHNPDLCITLFEDFEGISDFWLFYAILGDQLL